MWNDDLRTVFELLSNILKGLGTKVPSGLLDEFLKSQEGEGDVQSLADLVYDLEEYMESHFYNDTGAIPRIIRLENVFLPLNSIKKWKIIDHYNYKNNIMQYQIVLNETEGSPSAFDNLVVNYSNKEDRNKDLEKLIEMKQGHPLL